MFLSILAGFYFCKQKTAYEMRISDWSSDVCSSDLSRHPLGIRLRPDFYLTVPHGPCACFGATLEIESNRSRRHVADGPDGDPVGGQLDSHEALGRFHRPLRPGHGTLRSGFCGFAAHFAGYPTIAEVSSLLADIGHCSVPDDGVPVSVPVCTDDGGSEENTS